MEVKIIKSNRGEDILEYNNHTFYFAYKTKPTNIIRWRCTHRKCSAKLFTSGENMTIVRDESVHINHDDKNLNVYKINQLCKIKARESPYEKPAKILRNVVQNSTVSNGITTKDVSDLRRNIYNTKRKILPKFPVSLNEVHIMLLTMNIKTHTVKQFILMEHLIIVRNYSPNCLHGYFNNNYVPLVLVLLPNKTKQMYANFLNILVLECQNVGLILKPITVICDFEESIHIALREVWNNVNIFGCRFHLTQSWYRKIHYLGLCKAYKNNKTSEGEWLNNIFGWAVASSSSSFTTNACESFHSKFNSEFYHPHPQIFSFIKVPTDFQTDTYIKLSSLHITPRITSQTCQRTKQIQDALDQYNSKLILRTSFIELVAYKYKKRVSIKTVKLFHLQLIAKHKILSKQIFQINIAKLILGLWISLSKSIYRNTIEKIIDFNFGANYNSHFLLPEDGANYISLFWCKLQTHFKKMVQITHVNANLTMNNNEKVHITETLEKQQECTASNIQIGTYHPHYTYVQKLEKSLIENGSFNRTNAAQQQPRVNQNLNENIENQVLAYVHLNPQDLKNKQTTPLQNRLSSTLTHNRSRKKIKFYFLVYDPLLINHILWTDERPHFYDGTLTGRRYLDFLRNDLQLLLDDLPLATHGAPAHNAQIVQEFLREKFIATHGPIKWPQGHLKNVVYADPLINIQDLKNKITHACNLLNQNQIL
ncbi:hypothetical protein AGLY_002212 [Aphis glycines]|uniref:FLYWCH-type domain-containing protein n=1 Tax=Aphis glycines TaxID=307491 RepID=A0A6G0U554_APHGL|nr:hypothetical protein AGLY_002212 [Aphis glycines]